VKVGDLVKWTSKTSPEYYGKRKEYLGIILNIRQEHSGCVPVAEIWTKGKVTHWHAAKLEVISESR
jgi:hypothetical protein